MIAWCVRKNNLLIINIRTGGFVLSYLNRMNPNAISLYYSVVLRLVSYERKGHLEMASAKSVPAMAGDKLQNFMNFSNSELQAEVFD